jgi:hypothetical protein
MMMFLSNAVLAAEDEPVPVQPIPVVKYVMASPRACLLGPTLLSTNIYWRPAGAAENFARANGALKVAVGTRAVFCLSRELEGVWYKGSYGCIGTSLELQWCRGCKCEECDCDCNNCTIGSETQASSSQSATSMTGDTKVCPWVTIGRDSAKDVRKGPSIGRAKVGVPVLFKTAGIYYLRGIVHTYANPWLRSVDAVNAASRNKVMPLVLAASDKDVVYVRVHVLDNLVDDANGVDEKVNEPDVTYIRLMPDDQSTEDDVELDSSEAVELIDPDVFAEEWGQDCVISPDDEP